MSEICANCQFEAGQQCHRFPPPFPPVNFTDWCGEFKAVGGAGRPLVKKKPSDEPTRRMRKMVHEMTKEGAPPQP